jgi:hypothetical protein
MKKILSISILTALTFVTNAQNWFDEDGKKAKSESNRTQVMKEGEFMITGFGSYPNFGRYLAQTSLIGTGITGTTTKGIAPAGVQFEYMLSNNIAFTMDGFYNSFSANWKSQIDVFDPITGTFNTQTYNNSISEQRFRLLFGLNYHFDEIENEKFNFYAGFAAGINQRKRVIDVSDSWGDAFWEFYLRSPIAIRARSGIRFFVNQNVGLNLELGAGGPVLRFGVTYRFIKDLEKIEQKNKL